MAKTVRPLVLMATATHRIVELRQGLYMAGSSEFTLSSLNCPEVGCASPLVAHRRFILKGHLEKHLRVQILSDEEDLPPLKGEDRSERLINKQAR